MRNIKFILLIVLLLPFIGCEKTEKFNNTDTQVGESRVTFFPVLTMSGKAVMSVVKGTTFNDPGVKATESGKEIPVIVSGTVNANAVGYYKLTYSATNKDGFASSTERVVVVIPEAETPGVDISGEYKAIGGAPANAIITKQDAGLYYTTNCWGGGSLAVIPAYFICTNGTEISIPLQDLGNGYGRIVTQTPGTYTNGLIVWTVSRLDFPLTLQKSWQKI
jgi:hypothetical protein